MIKPESITEKHLEVLRKLGNIGAVQAASALSQMLNKKVEMNVPSVRAVPFNELSDAIGGEEVIVAAVLLPLKGDIQGNMFFMLPLDEANQLAGELLHKEDINLAKKPMEEMEASTLNEVGNILAGAYLAALSDFSKLNMQLSPPAAACDMAMAIISYGLIKLSLYADAAIIINTSIHYEKGTFSGPVHGYFLLLPDAGSLDILFLSLRDLIDE